MAIRSAEDFARSLPTPGYDQYAKAYTDAVAKGATGQQAADIARAALEGKTVTLPAVTPPQPEQEPAPQVVTATTGVNKIIVKVLDKSVDSRVPVQKEMTIAEAEARGIKIPERVRTEAAVWAYQQQSGVSRRQAEEAIDTLEAGGPPLTGKGEKALEQFADRNGMTKAAALETLQRYQELPESTEWKDLKPRELRDLKRLSGAVGDAGIYGYVRQQKAMQELVKDKLLNRDGSLNLEKAVRAGKDDRDNLEAAGFRVTADAVKAERQRQAAINQVLKYPDLYVAIHKGVDYDTVRRAGFGISRAEYDEYKKTADDIASDPGASAYRVAFLKDGITGYNKLVRAQAEVDEGLAQVYRESAEFKILPADIQRLFDPSDKKSMTKFRTERDRYFTDPKVIMQLNVEQGKTPTDVFNEMITSGQIQQGSTFAGVNDDGSISYYPPGTVRKIANNEIVPYDFYAQSPDEWRRVMDKEGLAALQERVENGRVPMPEKWFGDAWTNTITGEVVSDAERQQLVKDYNETMQALAKAGKMGSNEWDEARQYGNPQDYLVRSGDAELFTEKLAQAVNTAVSNTEAKIVKGLSERGAYLSDVRQRDAPAKEKMGGQVGFLLGATGVITNAFGGMPNMAVRVVKGRGQEVVNEVVEGIGQFGKDLFVLAVERTTPVSPIQLGEYVGNAYMIMKIADMAKRKADVVVTYVAPRGMPGMTVAREYTTGRLPYDISGIAKADLGKAFTEVLRQSAKPGGAATGEVAIPNTGKSLKYFKTPLQQVTGNLLLHGYDQPLTSFVRQAVKPGEIPTSVLITRGSINYKPGEGLTVVGDLHGTYTNVISDINAGYRRSVITGNPPKTWEWKGEKQTIVQVGDIVDRGADYAAMRLAFNRLAEQADKTGGKVVRLLGNHELAYLTGESIRGIRYTNREAVRQGILDDIKPGKLLAAYAENGQLFTHAGVSTRLFSEFKGKSAEYIAKELNKRLEKAIKTGDFSDKMFKKGRAEGGSGVGGVFWMRTQESPKDLDLGYRQFVGHTPHPAGVREAYKNFIETDIGRQWAKMREGQTRTFQETPESQTKFRKEKTAGRSAYIPIKKEGLYTSPYAAYAFADEGILMILTDAEKIKTTGPAARGAMTGSKAYIRGKGAGTYGPSKTWLGDVEPEVVIKGSLEVPKPTGDLFTRLVAGKNADFFTYDSVQGKYLPVKVAIDRNLLKEGNAGYRAPTVGELYAAKLYALRQALDNVKEAVRHPKRTAEDILTRREAPGVRDIEMVRNYGAKIDELAARLESKVKGKGRETDVKKAYEAGVKELLKRDKDLASRYRRSSRARRAFENLYRAAALIGLESRMRKSLSRERSYPAASLREPPVRGEREAARQEPPRGSARPREETGRDERRREYASPEESREAAASEEERAPAEDRELLREPDRAPAEPEETTRQPPTRRATPVPERRPVPVTPTRPVPVKGSRPDTPKREWTKKDIESALAYKRNPTTIVAIRAPGTSQDDIRLFSAKNPPEGLRIMKSFKGPGSRQKSARALRGNKGFNAGVDDGVIDTMISGSRKKPQLTHIADRPQKTNNPLTTKGLTIGGIPRMKAPQMKVPSFISGSGMRNLSMKRGRVYRTKTAGGTILSRRPIRGF